MNQLNEHEAKMIKGLVMAAVEPIARGLLAGQRAKQAAKAFTRTVATAMNRGQSSTRAFDLGREAADEVLAIYGKADAESAKAAEALGKLVGKAGA